MPGTIRKPHIPLASMQPCTGLVAASRLNPLHVSFTMVKYHLPYSCHAVLLDALDQGAEALWLAGWLSILERQGLGLTLNPEKGFRVTLGLVGMPDEWDAVVHPGMPGQMP